jgi:hypothetical protein
MHERRPTRRHPEHSKPVSSLVEQFQKSLTTLPEFRQEITKKYFAQPANATSEEVDTVIGTFFSKDSQKSISTKSFIPGVHFEKDGYTFDVNYSSQARQLTVLRKKDESFLLISIASRKDMQDTVWYSEDPKSIRTDQEEAHKKAKELLTSLNPQS